MTSLNFALHADAIIPVAGPDNIVTGKSLIVREGLIDGFIATDDARRILDVEHIELPGHTLMPGLVNAHGHAAMTLLRGYADDMPLDHWLNEKIWPMEGKWVAPDFVRDGTEIAAAAKAAGVYVLIEAAVGGGIPIIEPLKQSLGGNRIDRVSGIINGTTNYILTRMAEEGAAYDAVLADAQRLGYAEADPAADVDGLDAADKIAILSTLAFGGPIDRSAIPTTGISALQGRDVDYARQLGYGVKLLAVAERLGDAGDDPLPLSLRVQPTLVPKDHLAAAIGLTGATFNGSRFVGPAIAGILISVSGSGVVLAVVAATFTQFCIALLAIKVQEPERKPGPWRDIFGDMATGIKYGFTHPGIRFLLIMLGITGLLIRPVIELMPGFAAQVFDSGSDGFAILMSAINFLTLRYIKHLTPNSGDV